MPYAVLEKEIERLDETQQNTVVLFVRFLLSQKAAAAWGVARGFFQANAFASLFDVVPAESRASAVGFLNVLAALVCSSAPLSLGALSQRFGTCGLAVGFAAMGALLLLGATVLMVAAFSFHGVDLMSVKLKGKRK